MRRGETGLLEEQTDQVLLIGQVNHEQLAAATHETLNEVIWLLDRLKAMSGCSDEHLAESLERLAQGYRQFRKLESVPYGPTRQRGP